MIKLSNVCSFQKNQSIDLKKKKEVIPQTVSHNQNMTNNTVAPSLDHLKANFISFNARLVRKESKFVEPPYLVNLMTPDSLSTLMKFKPYDKTAEFIAMNCFDSQNTMLVHERGAMPELVANNFVGMLANNKFKNLGMTKENTDVYFLDVNYAKEVIQENTVSRINERLNPDDPFLNIPQVQQEEQMKPDPSIQKCVKHWIDKAEKENKNTIIFISDPTISFPGLSDKVKTVSFTEAETDYEHPENYLSESAKQLMERDPALQELQLETPGAPETKRFLKANKDFLIAPNLPANTVISDKAIDKAVNLTKEQEGSYPGKAIDFIMDTLPAVLMKKTTKPNAKYSIITPKNIQKAVKAYPELAMGVHEEKPPLSLKDVGGIEPLEETIKETILNKIGKKGTKNAQVPPSSILISGQRGAGKTLLAEAIAGEAKSPLVNVSMTEFLNYINPESDVSFEVANVFEGAKLAAKDSDNKTAFLYLDNFEELMENTACFDEMSKQIKQIDNKNSDVNLVVLAGVTQAEALQPEFSKVGIFDTQLPVPDNANSMKTRIATLNVLTKDLKFDPANKEKIIKEVAKITNYSNGADLKTIVNKATAIAEKRKDNKALGLDDFTEAYLELVVGPKMRADIPEWDNEATIKHEIGHAITGQTLFNQANEKWLRPDEINFITFDQHEGFLGAVFFDRGEGGSKTFDTIIDEMAVDYGSIYVERMMFGGRSTYGPSMDLKMAMNSAKIAVNRYGLGPHTGFVTDDKMMVKENKEDITLMVKTASKIAEMIVDFHKDFINEYGDKCYKNLGKGGNTMSAESFKNELNSWLDKGNRREELKTLNAKIAVLTEEARVNGKFIDNNSELNSLVKKKLDGKANS
ncbi:MAG: AAA family ATPase [bacterium]